MNIGHSSIQLHNSQATHDNDTTVGTVQLIYTGIVDW